MVNQWAQKWNIPPQAMRELAALAGIQRSEYSDTDGSSEARVDSILMLEAAQKNVLLWRNNVGALKDNTGRYVRYGLANESSKMNAKIKSSDRIGIRRVLITQSMVGYTIGQFVAREVKHADWLYDPNDEHVNAQLTFLNLINIYGGDAKFCTGLGTL